MSTTRLEYTRCQNFGHVYLEWGSKNKVLYTKAELTRLHKAFYHPANYKILGLLKRANKDKVEPQDRDNLNIISDSCDTCQRHGPKPLSFKVALPNGDNLVFGDEISMDLMFINGNDIVHIVDTATKFSAATFLDSNNAVFGQTVEGIWTAFLEAWCTVYTGYPNRLRVDGGSAFTSPRWKDLSNMAGINLYISGVEAHNSLGLGQRLHSPLRRIYLKIEHDFPHVSPEILFRIALKAMNDTIGENGLVPSLLVFGIIPRFPILRTELPAQRERMKVIADSQMEMNTIIAERRIATALRKKVPLAADRVYSVNDEVLIYREAEKKWTGPFSVTNVSGKIISVTNLSGTYRA